MFGFRRRKKRKRGSSTTKHYLEHKELARTLVKSRLEYFNEHYKLEWNRVSIKNQKRCWGSCSSLKNLNFNYKIIFLPDHLADYIVVHEMCHLVHLHHKQTFWDLVGEVVPDYRRCVAELKVIDKNGSSVKFLSTLRENYPSRATTPAKLGFGGVTSSLPSVESCGCSEVCNCSSYTD